MLVGLSVASWSANSQNCSQKINKRVPTADMTFLSICRYAGIGECQYADIANIFTRSALKMFADSRY